MEHSERHFDQLQNLIDKAFKRFFKGEDSIMEFDNENNTQPMGAVARAEAGEIFESIEDYKQRTGKRFRMTKDQKHRGLTRDMAFTETYGENK
jgi:hypothetical protein